MAIYYDVGRNQNGVIVRRSGIELQEVGGAGAEFSRSAAVGPLPLSPMVASSCLVMRVGEGGRIATHAVPSDGLVFVMAGAGVLGLSETERLDFVAGDVILVRADVQHWWDGSKGGFTAAVVLAETPRTDSNPVEEHLA